MTFGFFFEWTIFYILQLSNTGEGGNTMTNRDLEGEKKKCVDAQNGQSFVLFLCSCTFKFSLIERGKDFNYKRGGNLKKKICLKVFYRTLCAFYFWAFGPF